MAKFFNKNYKHAYERHNKVWVKGTVDNHPYKRISTGKEFNKANMNWAEKHWRDELRRHFDGKRIVKLDNNMPTLDEYALESFEQHESSRDFSTTKKYREKYKLHISPILGSYKLNELRVADIRNFHTSLIEKELSHKYAQDINTIVSGILSDAIENEIIDKNVVRNLRFPKKDKFSTKEREVEPLKLEDAELLIEEAEGQLKNILTFLFFTGTRPGEMIALMWKDIDFEKKKIHICRTRQGKTNPKTGKKELGSTKTGKTRTLDMIPRVVEALLDQQRSTIDSENEFVFITQRGEAFKGFDTIRRKWYKLLEECSIQHKVFYLTRHSFASIFLSNGEEADWVSAKMLGHASMTTTNKYYRKYMEDDTKERGAFLNKNRTKSVRDETKVS